MKNTVSDCMTPENGGRFILDRYQRSGALDLLWNARDAFDAKLMIFALCWVDSRLGSPDLARSCWEAVAGVTVTDRLWDTITNVPAMGPLCARVREIALAYNVYTADLCAAHLRAIRSQMTRS